MIIYLCMKYESNTPMFLKDITRKPFFVRTGQNVRDVRIYVRTDVRTRVMLYAPPPIINGGGIKNQSKEEDKDQESIQSSITPDPGHHMGKHDIDVSRPPSSSHKINTVF